MHIRIINSNFALFFPASFVVVVVVSLSRAERNANHNYVVVATNIQESSESKYMEHVFSVMINFSYH
jgi:general stress protein CsbA